MSCWFIGTYSAIITPTFIVLVQPFLFTVVLYASSAIYFAGVMVRLMLTLTPVVCVFAAIAFSHTFENYLKDDPVPGSESKNSSSDSASEAVSTPVKDPSRVSILSRDALYARQLLHGKLFFQNVIQTIALLDVNFQMLTDISTPSFLFPLMMSSAITKSDSSSDV